MTAAERKQHTKMLSRTHQSSFAGRSASMRRLRRRNITNRLYCRTNGCTSFLELKPERGVAVCPVCGYTRRLS
jgi:hypothetical protein